MDFLAVIYRHDSDIELFLRATHAGTELGAIALEIGDKPHVTAEH